MQKSQQRRWECPIQQLRLPKSHYREPGNHTPGRTHIEQANRAEEDRSPPDFAVDKRKKSRTKMVVPVRLRLMAPTSVRQVT